MTGPGIKQVTPAPQVSISLAMLRPSDFSKALVAPHDAKLGDAAVMPDALDAMRVLG
jgi:hypothetical protein